MLSGQRKSIGPNLTKDLSVDVKATNGGVNRDEGVFVDHRPTNKMAKFDKIPDGAHHLGGYMARNGR
jgi:hypothetical protein